MDELVHVILAIDKLTIDKVHSTTEGPGLWTRLRWVKPGFMGTTVPFPHAKGVCRMPY